MIGVLRTATRTIAPIALWLVIAFAAVKARLEIPTITFLTLPVLVTLTGSAMLTAHRTGKRWVKIPAWCALPLAFLPMAIVVGSLSAYAVNSWRLSVFAKQLVANPPPGTTAHQISAQVGLLMGNGDHCDFIVSVRVRGDVEKAHVEKHYAALPVSRAIPGERTNVRLEVDPTAPAIHTVTVTDVGNKPATDIRCF